MNHTDIKEAYQRLARMEFDIHRIETNLSNIKTELSEVQKIIRRHL